MEEEKEEKKDASLDEKKEDVEVVKRPEEKKKSKGKVVVPIVVCVIAAAVVVLCVFITRQKLGGKSGSIKQTASKYSSEYRMSGNSIEDFDLAFLKLENKEVNKIYSPLSIKYTLQMLGEGSDGDTKDQIDAVIGDYKSKKYNNNEHMSFANAFFVKDSFKDSIKSDYVDSLSKKYNADVVYDPFTSAAPVNNWVKEKTFNLVNNITDDESMAQYNFILVNSLAIDMNWNYLMEPASGASIPAMKYDTYYAHEDYYDSVPTIDKVYGGDKENYPSMTFNGVENTKSVIVAASINNYDIIKDLGEDSIRKTVGDEYDEFLAKGGCGDDLSKDEYLDQYIRELKTNYQKVGTSTDYMMIDDDDMKVFAKDLREYDGMTLQYVGIMPKKVSLAEYVKNLNASELTKVVKNLKEIKAENFEDGAVINVKGNIPLFNYSYDLNLMDDLKELGIKDAFSDGANFSRMTTDTTQKIVDAKHKANIEFSNEGIKAAATTFMGGGGSSGCYFDHIYKVPVKKIDLTFDKPYMYIIRDKDSGEVWFIGTVYEPEKN